MSLAARTYPMSECLTLLQRYWPQMLPRVAVTNNDWSLATLR